MHLASRARATTFTLCLRLPGAGRWTLPLVLTGLALGSACSVDPGGAAPSSGATPTGSRTEVHAASPDATSPDSAASTSPSPSASDETEPEVTRIRVVVGDRTYTGELYGNATARDLADRLPLEVSMDDLHGTEKTGRLPQALTTEGAPRGSDPEVGEIGYYAPGRDLVFYYGEMGYYPGIVRVGRFSESIDALADAGDGLIARVEVR